MAGLGPLFTNLTLLISVGGADLPMVKPPHASPLTEELENWRLGDGRTPRRQEAPLKADLALNHPTIDPVFKGEKREKREKREIHVPILTT